MAATSLSHFIPLVRALLDDDDPLGFHRWEDEAMLAAVRGVFQMGQGPADVTLADDDFTLDPGVPYGSDFAIVALRAARLRLGGTPSGVAIKTRALSVGERGFGRSEQMNALERLLHEHEGATADWQQADFYRWLNEVSGGWLAKTKGWPDLCAPGFCSVSP